MNPSVKPLVRWALFHKYSVRYTSRQPDLVEGVFGTPAGSVPFRFAPGTRMLVVDSAPPVTLNEYGWEVNAAGEVIIKGYRKPAPPPTPQETSADTHANEAAPDDTSVADTSTAGTERIEAADGAGVSE